MDSPKQLWSPTEEFVTNSNLTHYQQWLASHYNLTFEGYHHLWQWSVENIALFWESIWKYFHIESHAPYSKVLDGKKMPGYRWFTGATLSFSKHVFRKQTDKYPAIIFKKEGGKIQSISWSELEGKVLAIRNHLAMAGVKKGDAVVAYLPNSPEAIISFLAVNSLGAIWSSCSPDFGTSSIVDRFAQIKPKVMIAVDGYSYGGRSYDKAKVVGQVVNTISSIEEVIYIPYENTKQKPGIHARITSWEEALSDTSGELSFTPVDFNDPIWVLYSSGTTGIPKAITHSQGGILLEHLKYLSFHNNVKPGDRCFWYTTTGWMMWNYIQSALLCQGTVVLYDGSPAYPEIDALWEFADEANITHFGTSAGYIVANMKKGTHPGQNYGLSKLTSIGSTGSPLPPEGFDWVYKEVKENVWLTSMSGGTDVCSAFVGGNPQWPVYEGEIQCRALGCKLEAYNEAGEALENKMGEMVITKPMPSMPIYLWGDDGNTRYKESYFDTYPGVWRHGDWTKITSRKGVVIYGRSDATLNRGGVRIGTSEVYRAVDKIKEVADSLIICIEGKRQDYMPLFVKMAKGQTLNPKLKDLIKAKIREEYSPRHVPDEIIEVPDIPYTISGKKTEPPVKKVLMGKDINQAMNKDALRNPESMDFFMDFAKQL